MPLKTINKFLNKSKVSNINPELFHNMAIKFSKKAEKSEFILKKMKKTFYVESEKNLSFKI